MTSAENSSNSNWVVLKFGGTSVSTAARWQVIISQVKELVAADYKVWVVISALSQVTNLLTSVTQVACTNDSKDSFKPLLSNIIAKHVQLIQECNLLIENSNDVEVLQNRLSLAISDTSQCGDSNPLPSTLTPFAPLINSFHQLSRLLEGVRLTREASPRTQARILSYGEILSTQLGILILHHNNILKATLVDGKKYLRSSDLNGSNIENRYLQAQILPESLTLPQSQVDEISNFSIVLTQGFVATTSDNGETCLLGRGGSDTSASLFGAILKAERVEIWTDVHGLFTSDPRKVPQARLITSMSFRQAQELAAMGAKVLHPRCIGPAQFANIPVHIRNTDDPNGERTEIVPETTKVCTAPQIMAVVRRSDMTLVTLTSYDMWGASGFLSNVFAPFARFHCSVDLIATSQYSVSVTLDHIPGGVSGTTFKSLISELKSLRCDVSVLSPCATVSIVGKGLRRSLYCMGPVLECLEGHEVHLVSESSEDLNLSFVVDQASADSIVTKMHSCLFEANVNSNNLEKDDTSVLQRQHSFSCGNMGKVLGSTWTSLKANRP